jgi:hypothetical protein
MTKDEESWTQGDWEGLLYAIKYKRCTPFLGAGASAGTLPLGGAMADEWATRDAYPFEDRQNLPRVAQYVAVKSGANTPRDRIVDKFSKVAPPDFSRPDEIHGVVADLALPVYITTNYDDFMLKALERAKREPQRSVCRWHLARERQGTPPETPFPDPTPEKPLVYHLHGTLDEIESMVLTEDDYLDFLVAISESRLLPARIERAFAGSLLFLGYSLEDMNFKVLFRKLTSYMRRAAGAVHVSVQLSPAAREPSDEELLRASQQRQYLRDRFGLQNVKVYWGTCQQFALELRKQWTTFNP